MNTTVRFGPPKKLAVARILLADSDLASRLALNSLLSRAGYAVDTAATASEAIGKLDANEYQLVLADLKSESEDAGDALLSYARLKEFSPATALISSDLTATHVWEYVADSANTIVRMSQDNICHLLARIAELIGKRADRRFRQSLLRAS